MADDMILRGEGLTLRYGDRDVSRDLDVGLPRGKVTVIIGANACGKSTLLRAFSRLLTPARGRVVLDGRDVRGFGAKAFAQALALLPQASVAPFGIRVSELVARGRYPHQGLLQQWSAADEDAVTRALGVTGTAALADRVIDELSGGQRQRVWLAMTLAQDTPIILLDEPTTFLDIAHQLEVLELCRKLNRQDGRTVVMVLHDLNLAARYADHLIAMKAGAVVAAGPPSDIMSPELVREVFGVEALVMSDPATGAPLVAPTASLGMPS